MDSPYLELESLTATLAALVGVNSVNPSHGGPVGGERAALEWCAAFLRRVGLEPRLTGASPERPNLRVRLAGEGPGPPLMLESHIDTVSVSAMAFDPFAARVERGRLFGRGATDAKGQVAAMLHAVAAWASSGRRPPRPIELALVSDEEFGFMGARALVQEGIDAAGIVIGEPTDLRAVTTHKGTTRVHLRIEGRSAHAAKPELGVNAISAAAALVELIDTEYAAELRRREAPLLGCPTISAGVIQGGLQVNLVPHECHLHLDRRTLPGETQAAIAAEFEDLFARLRRRRPTFKAVWEPPTLIAEPIYTDPECPLARIARQAAAAQGGTSEPAGVDYATDASILAATGLPIVIIGPGSIDQAHTADEFIELDEVLRGARLFADLIGRATL